MLRGNGGRRARVEDAKRLGRQRQHPQGCGFEVVDEPDALGTERAGQRRLVDRPAEIGEIGAARDHRPGDAEAGGRNPRPAGRGEKFAENGREGPIALAREFRDDALIEPAAGLDRHAEHGLRTANIAGQYQGAAPWLREEGGVYRPVFLIAAAHHP